MANSTVLTPEQHDAAQDLFAQCITMQAVFWDTVRELERITGHTLATNVDFAVHNLDSLLEGSMDE